MPRKIKIAVLFYSVLFLSVFFFSSLSYAQMMGRRSIGFFPAPTLLYPTTGNIDLSGKESLEFRWERLDLANTRYFYFKLYKGYDTTEASLILKQQSDKSVYPIQIPASQFEAGQTYTWVLQQVFLSGDKSDRAFSSFTITSK
ncbi:MAG: hypothetical protein PHU91_04105 [Candidatus Omnitrophica bacterium]|nr:hypothetical protein [Candidatus Omnitrophota bacterium]MDD5236824.1 hypothetical protein [Candidatus Omnitrophota bacterium]MDD5611174.1 hypothetical protein [Candidatus Omnitrophota bacterium]